MSFPPHGFQKNFKNDRIHLLFMYNNIHNNSTHTFLSHHFAISLNKNVLLLIKYVLEYIIDKIYKNKLHLKKQMFLLN